MELMGRSGKNKRPALPDGPLKTLNDALRDLHLKAGQPSLAEMARAIAGGPSRSSLHDALTSSNLPKRDTIDALVGVLVPRVRGLDADEAFDRFNQLWLAAALAVDAPSSDGDHPREDQSGGREGESARRSHVELTPLPEVQALATHLSSAIHQLELTAAEFARRVKLSPTVVTGYLSGERIPPQGFTDVVLSSVTEVEGESAAARLRPELDRLRIEAIRARYASEDIGRMRARLEQADSDTRQELEIVIKILEGSPESWPDRVVAVLDLQRFSALTDREQQIWREALYEAVRQTLAQANIDPGQAMLKDRGDGLVILFGPSVPANDLVTYWLSHFWFGLSAVNANLARPVLVRMALMQGAAGTDSHGGYGPAVVQAHRLIESRDLRDLLRQRHGELAVAIPDDLYQLIGQASPYSAAQARLYAKVDLQLKDGSTTAWVRAFEPLGPRS
ncbi:hypothetical protein ACFVVX_15945 [Kitasatospora sp. NPDC058170]|uniref:hypothetical protein n=1 Tax=Kitasatospora sp. NPDC058170 TaxID=3346364 RepID=UPI0036DBC9F0